MPEIIQNWLGTTLGVILDMSPDKFGRNTKDGKLLAKLLYNYGVIPAQILNSVKESKNYYECYNNLVLLKPWLKYIGVTHDNSTLQKMAGGEGSAAISIFYAVYLNLERKDRFHYLSAQKEKRLSDDSCQKFKVNWVPETIITGSLSDSVSKLAAPLFENREMIEWHKANCQKIIEQIKRTKAKYEKTVRSKPELGPLVSKHATSQPLDKKQLEAEEVRGNITEFEKKHLHESPNLNYSELIGLQNMYEMQPCVAPSFSEAKNIISNIKSRKRGDVFARSFQQEMQCTLLDEQWKEIVEKQNKNFENTVCANLLKQSQYEKQMTKKLYSIRNQKKVLAENRRKIECLKIDQYQKEYDENLNKNVDVKEKCWNEELEKEKIAELHRRLYDEKARLRRAWIKAECWKICESFVDIAIRISEVRELIGCQIPKAFMKDLKQLYFKDLPIFDLLDHLESLYDNDAQPNLALLSECAEEEESVFYPNEEYEQLKLEEMSRQSILDECDFNDYIHLLGPWMVELLFPNGSETEVKHLVLGYVVHKLLEIKYPAPNVPVHVEVKPMKPTAVVQGLNDETAVNMLVDLMEICKVLVVRVNDAINFVLSVYKEELSVVRDIDIAFQKATEESLKQKNVNWKEKEVKKKVQLLKKESAEKPLEDASVQHKETQTPRMIPEDDPLLSPNAELGKLAFEALGAGDPVPDTVIVGAIVAYVVSKQDNYEGWVLLNYPLLYAQASDLEYFLTGFRILPVVEEMETLEEVEGFSYRGPWKDPFSKNNFNENSVSRLVPRPDVFSEQKVLVPKTYFDSFIKMKKVPETPYRRSDDLEDTTSLEKFYTDVEIFLNFEYQNMNFQTMKNLGKTILKAIEIDSDTLSVTYKNSIEVFGNVLVELNEKWEPKKKGGGEAGGMKKIIKEPLIKRDFEIVEMVEEEEEEEKEATVEIKSQVPEVSLAPPKPGDPTWEWATGPQPEGLLLALASLWENMEAVYIEDFKDVFFSLRVHHSNVIGYIGHIRKFIQILMRRPDEKQKVLCDFQQMFNEIEEDLRPDVDIKCELHVRVSELEQALMSIADGRKNNSTKDVMKLAQDGWVPDEMANLINIFLTALQLEADRCIDSCQVIMDYYTSLQQKIPDEKQLGKISVPKLQMQDQKYSVLSTTPNKTISSSSPRNSELKRSIKSMSEQGNKVNLDRLSKTRSLTDKRKRSSDSGIVGAADFIMGVLTNLRLPDDGLTPFHNFFMETVQLVTKDVKAVIEGCLLEAKKGDKPVASTNRQTKNKKASETKIPSSNEGLNAEWTTALENELSRFSFRSQLILARGIFDTNEFLTTILNVLSSLMEEITGMYLKEIHSISECCKVFRCGIEEEISIQPILELKEDEFFIYTNYLNAPESVEKPVEEDRRFRFTVDQLSLLFQKLQRVAPDGEIIKRSLVYIFEDLRMLKPEVENFYCFPEIWNEIEPDDVTTILNEIYQDLEIVPWKDFIIYALELPSPTEIDILSMRRAFRAFDPFVTEIISRDNYDTVAFWFEKTLDQYTSDCNREKDRMEKAKDLLYRMYQVNECQTNYSALLLAFCKDENPTIGFVKALTLAMGKIISIGEESDRDVPSFLGEVDDFDRGLFDDTAVDSSSVPFCCPTVSSEVIPKCIPKEKIVRCECKDDQESLTVDTSEDQGLNYAESREEDGEYYYSDFKPFQQSPISSVIPYNILSCLLKASFPSLPQLSILLDCEQTFQETLSSIYDSVESYDNGIDIRKLLKHKFMHRLLQCTNKFRFVHFKPILLSVAKVKPSTSRAMCIKNKPNVSFCLRK